MDDLISRKEAIKIVDNMLMGERNHKILALEQLTDLPPIIPKTGHWIIKGRNLVDDFIPIGHFCSECGGQALLNPYGMHLEILSYYCPHCGRRMEGDENGR